MDELIAIPGQSKGSWKYLYQGFIFAAHQRKASDRIEPEGVFKPAPVGKYRCSQHRKGCSVMLTKVGRNKIEGGNKNHGHTPSNHHIAKYKLYLKLREEGQIKPDISNANIVKSVIALEEFKEVSGTLMFATMESVVRDSRKKIDGVNEPKSWTEFAENPDSLRQGHDIFLEKVEEMQNNATLYFGRENSFTLLETASRIHFQFLRQIKTNFEFNMCVIHIADENNETTMPIMSVIYETESYEILRSIMFHLVRRVPAIQNVEEITTELTETVIKVLKLCFQSAKLRCIWFYYIQEISQSWMELELPFDMDCILKSEGQLLKYSWALPLALQHRRAENFNDVVMCLDKLKTLDDFPNTAIFKDQLKEKWRSRVNYILPYSSNEKYSNSLEASERQLTLKFLVEKMNTYDFLKKLSNYFCKSSKRHILLRTAAIKEIIFAGRQTGYDLEKFLENCLTKDALKNISTKIEMEKYCDFRARATCDINDLRNHQHPEPDPFVPAIFRRSHLKGPGDGKEKRLARQQHLDDIINQVAAGTDEPSTSSNEEQAETLPPLLPSPLYDQNKDEDDNIYSMSTTSPVVIRSASKSTATVSEKQIKTTSARPSIFIEDSCDNFETAISGQSVTTSLSNQKKNNNLHLKSSTSPVLLPADSTKNGGKKQKEIVHAGPSRLLPLYNENEHASGHIETGQSITTSLSNLNTNDNLYLGSLTTQSVVFPPSKSKKNGGRKQKETVHSGPSRFLTFSDENEHACGRQKKNNNLHLRSLTSPVISLGKLTTSIGNKQSEIFRPGPLLSLSSSSSSSFVAGNKKVQDRQHNHFIASAPTPQFPLPISPTITKPKYLLVRYKPLPTQAPSSHRNALLNNPIQQHLELSPFKYLPDQRNLQKQQEVSKKKIVVTASKVVHNKTNPLASDPFSAVQAHNKPQFLPDIKKADNLEEPLVKRPRIIGVSKFLKNDP